MEMKCLKCTRRKQKQQDLWKQLDLLNEKYDVSWRWVKGHQIEETEDSRYNNLADELARDAVK